jgi:hypothetical protein
VTDAMHETADGHISAIDEYVDSKATDLLIERVPRPA